MNRPSAVSVRDIIKGARRIVICGIGNVERGDYGFGVYLAESLIINLRNPSFLPLNCYDVPGAQAGSIIRFQPDLVIIAVPIELGEEPGKLFVADPWEALGDVFPDFRIGLEATLNHLRDNLPDTRFLLLGCQPGSWERVTEEIKNTVRALTLEFVEAMME